MISPDKFIGFKADITLDITEEIREAQAEDESLSLLIDNTERKEELPPSVRKQFDCYHIEAGILWYDNRIYVPEDKDIRKRILEVYHDSPSARHQGESQTMELVS